MPPPVSGGSDDPALESYSVATGAFCRVEAPIRVCQNIGHFPGMRVERGSAYAHRQRHVRLPLDSIYLLPYRLGDLGRRRKVNVLQKHPELFAADAADNVTFPHCTLDRACDLDQRLVSFEMPEPIIYLLEMISVHEQKDIRLVSGMCRRQTLQEGFAVKQTRHLIEAGGIG